MICNKMRISNKFAKKLRAFYIAVAFTTWCKKMQILAQRQFVICKKGRSPNRTVLFSSFCNNLQKVGIIDKRQDKGQGAWSATQTDRCQCSSCLLSATTTRLDISFPGAGSTSHMLTPPGKCLRIQGFTGCKVTGVGVSIPGLCPGLRICCTSTETAMLWSAKVRKEETIANQALT